MGRTGDVWLPFLGEGSAKGLEICVRASFCFWVLRGPRRCLQVQRKWPEAQSLACGGLAEIHLSCSSAIPCRRKGIFGDLAVTALSLTCGAVSAQRPGLSNLSRRCVEVSGQFLGARSLQPHRPQRFWGGNGISPMLLCCVFILLCMTRSPHGVQASLCSGYSSCLSFLTHATLLAYLPLLTWLRG